MTALPPLALALALTAGPGGPEPGVASPRIALLAGAIDPARMAATVGRLVGFGTRHTLSDTVSQTRGIGAARRWLAGEFKFTAEPGPRVPKAVELVNVGAILPGADPARAKQAIVVTGHYDSRASDPLDALQDAPGANDDGSGVATVLELARVLAREKPAVSV